MKPKQCFEEILKQHDHWITLPDVRHFMNQHLTKLIVI